MLFMRLTIWEVGCSQSLPVCTFLSSSFIFILLLLLPLLISWVCLHPVRENIHVLLTACTYSQPNARVSFLSEKLGSGSTTPFALSLPLPLAFSLQTHGEMRKNHRLVSWLWKSGNENQIEGAPL